MKNSIYSFLLSLTLLTIALPTLSYAQQSATQPTPETTEFWQQLKQGGKVVLVRHAAIDKELLNEFVSYAKGEFYWDIGLFELTSPNYRDYCSHD